MTRRLEPEDRVRELDGASVPFKFDVHAMIYSDEARTLELKALLHNGAILAIQHSPELREYYLRKTAEGKNQMLVINNVCNKLIHRVFACVRERRKYKESFSLLVA